MIKTVNNQLPATEDFYLKSSLYTFYKISGKDKTEIHKLLFDQKTLNCFCTECGRESIFISTTNYPSSGPYGMPTPHVSLWEFDLENEYKIFHTYFICAKNSEHGMSFHVQIKESTLGKIGQFPAIADIESNEILSFKKVLSKSELSEFKKAVGLYSYGIGVGSFVYLRRLLELYVMIPAHEKAKKSLEWNEDEYQKLRFQEKVDSLKSYLPDFLTDNPKIYSVISKGIHSLSEEECLEYFPIVKACLIYILTEAKAKKELEEAKKATTSELGKIISKLS